jgi:hypothetical protein
MCQYLDKVRQNIQKDSAENRYLEGKLYGLVGHCRTDKLCASSPMNKGL